MEIGEDFLLAGARLTMEERILKLASHVTHPVTAAVFALVLAFFAFRLALKYKKPRLATILAIAIVLFGLSPLGVSTFLQSRGVYRIRVVALGSDHQPVADALVTSSIGGEIKKANRSWELVVAPQTKFADAKVTIFASVRAEFLEGMAIVVLGDDYYPTVAVQLANDTSGVVRGIVIDRHRRSVAGAIVFIPGYSQEAITTDKMGNFVLPAHAAEGQMIQIRAQKGDLIADMSVPTGKLPIELVLREP